MSLKLVELQVAIPKTVDAGKIAEQQQQQNNVTQSQLAALAEKELMRKRASVNEFDKSEKTKLDKHKKQSPQSKEEDPMMPSKFANETNETVPTSFHPFKGRRVDFSG